MTADYPTSVTSKAQAGLHNTASNVTSTLSADITGTPATFTIASATGFPSAFFDVLIDSEIIHVTSRTGTTCTVGERGHDGTASIDHDSGTTVAVVFASDHAQKLGDEIIAIQTEVGATGSQNFIRHDDAAGSYAGHVHRTGASAYQVLKSNLAASVAPAVTDDSDSDYSVGSIWIDTTGDKVYVCYDASVGAALWQEVGAGGGGPAAMTVSLSPGQCIIPGTAGAILTQVEGTNLAYEVIDFNASTDSSALWQFTMPQSYDGNAFDVHVHSFASATTGDALLDIEMMRVPAGQVVDTAFTSLGTLTITPAGTTNQLVIDSDTGNTLTSLAGGDQVFLRIKRDADNGSDTMTGDLRVVGVDIDYTPA